MNRRQLLKRAGVAALALGASRFPLGWAAPADAPRKKVLCYTRSQAFQHSVVTRGPGKLTIVVDGQEKSYTIPGTATVVLDGKPAQLGDVQKDMTATLSLKGKDVTKVEAKTVSATTAPAPSDKSDTGKVTIATKDGKLSLAEQILTDLGAKHGFDVVCEKDGAIFTSKEFPTFDAFFFETTGDLTAEWGTDGTPPMSADGKKALLDAVAGGKGFVGSHCGSDTFHSKGDRAKTQPRDELDPYIAMLGGEFITHASQQKSTLIVADPKWPGLPKTGNTDINEEWYALKNFAPDLHVILVQDTKGMHDDPYQRPPYPETWARKHEKGRVFYTSMGHREDVWQSDFMQGVLLSGLAWVLGNVEADVTPNIEQAAPQANDLPGKK